MTTRLSRELQSFNPTLVRLGPSRDSPVFAPFSLAFALFSHPRRRYCAVYQRSSSTGLAATAPQMTCSMGAASTPSTSLSSQRGSRTL